MNLNAAALRILISKGMTLEDVAEFVAANEVNRDPTAAARMRKMREGKKRKSVTRNVTPEPPIEDHTPEVSEDKSSSPPMRFVLPADIPAEPWAGFEEMRKKIKKPMTDGARSLAVTELRRLRDEDGWPPGEVLNHCTMNSYQGIYPPKGRRNDRSSSQQCGKTTAAIAALGGFGDNSPM